MRAMNQRAWFLSFDMHLVLNNGSINHGFLTEKISDNLHGLKAGAIVNVTSYSATNDKNPSKLCGQFRLDPPPADEARVFRKNPHQNPLRRLSRNVFPLFIRLALRISFQRY